MRRMRGWVTVLATLSGCGPNAQPQTPAKPIVVDNPPPQFVVEPQKPPPPPAPTIDIQQLLAADVVQSDRFFRSTLYTWTSTEQIDELRKGKPLLSRDESPTNGGSYIDQVLHALATVRNPMARLLYTSAFAKMRFAWPTMWATRGGWPGETYGDRLIRITLKPEAWTVRLTTSTGTFEVHDAQDAVVPISTALATPHRIAAIYFISDRSQAAPTSVPRPIASFREYVLCNESMIASWEVGTDRIAREVAEATAKVESIWRWTDATKPVNASGTAVPTTWQPGAAPASTPITTYHQALALDSSSYWLDPSTLRQLITALAKTPKPATLERAPTAKLSATRTPRKAPRIVINNSDTFARPANMTAAHR